MCLLLLITIPLSGSLLIYTLIIYCATLVYGSLGPVLTQEKRMHFNHVFDGQVLNNPSDKLLKYLTVYIYTNFTKECCFPL